MLIMTKEQLKDYVKTHRNDSNYYTKSIFGSPDGNYYVTENFDDFDECMSKTDPGRRLIFDVDCI